MDWSSRKSQVIVAVGVLLIIVLASVTGAILGRFNLSPFYSGGVVAVVIIVGIVVLNMVLRKYTS